MKISNNDYIRLLFFYLILGLLGSSMPLNVGGHGADLTSNYWPRIQ